MEIQSAVDELKIILREKDIPFFEDDELRYYLAKHNQKLNDAAYELLIIKSENTALSTSGLTVADSSNYFRRMADRYRPRHTGVLKS